MYDAFISYRRDPSAALAHLIHKQLKNQHGIKTYLDVTRTDAVAVPFPDRLMEAIADSRIFICLLSDSTFESKWVREEIHRAYQLQKRCIPVFQEKYIKPAETDPAIDYMLKFDGVHIFDVKGVLIDESIAQIAGLVRQSQLKWWVALITITVLLTVLGIIGYMLSQPDDPDDEYPMIGTTAVAQEPSNTSSLTSYVETPIDSVPSTSAPSLTEFPTLTPTITPTLPLDLEPIMRNVDWAIPYPNGLVQEFNGFQMVLVPAGCFQMGNDPLAYYWNGDEWVQGVTAGGEQCFDEPYWIDKFEVTQSDFERLGGVQANPPTYVGTARPVVNITWFEARSFCEERGTRLPTEAEWEYAARGQDLLIYPWGNAWNAANSVWNRSGSEGTANVGSIINGASWVGALDMSGNVWEWTSTLLQDYPYSEADGRENNNQVGLRVLRSGSWGFLDSYALRVAGRGAVSPDLEGYSFGFRCVRDYNVFDLSNLATSEVTTTAAVTPTLKDSTIAMATFTETPIVTITQTELPGFQTITSNSEWQSKYPNGLGQKFNGIAMVLVPAGCFRMGNDPDAWYWSNSLSEWITGVPDGGQQCFEVPFWIDQYEITNGEFDLLGGEAQNVRNGEEPQHPYEEITWLEARDFCEKRGARLPTEAEWEYAARGPDELFFPWGNTFVDTTAVRKVGVPALPPAHCKTNVHSGIFPSV